MQLLLASAKQMRDEQLQLPCIAPSLPAFQLEATAIAKEMATYSVDELQALYQCSEEIARQNHARWAQFSAMQTPSAALLAYNGQAYKHLKATEFTDETYRYAQAHLWIASFLYGLLRPADSIHLYRLEGRAELSLAEGKTLFDYWKSRLTQALIASVQADDGVLLWLAPEEFTHLFHWKELCNTVRVVRPQFLVEKNGKRRAQAVWAKTCRGAMARFALTEQWNHPEALPTFAYEGFHYSSELSVGDSPVFLKYSE